MESKFTERTDSGGLVVKMVKSYHASQLEEEATSSLSNPDLN